MLLALVATIALGLGIRALCGGAFAKIAGDALYAVAAYFAFALVIRRPRVVAACALAYCFAIEFLQLWPALDPIRPTLFGRLVLGSVFSVYDLIWYALGVALAAITSRFALRSRGGTSDSASAAGA